MDRYQTVAGVVLTLNEERDLPRALKSLSWCDEILVVDSGSTDATCDIARQYCAQVIENIQEPPFFITTQRNFALNSGILNSDWVLFLDADEEVSPQLADQIRACIGSPHAPDAYELTPRYWFLGKWLKLTQGFPNWHPRLVRRGRAYFVGGVWESFSPGSTVGKIPIPYEHYAFSKGIDDWIDRHKKYSAWEASQILEFLSSKDRNTLSQRYQNLRILMSRYWWLRPPLRFIQKYLLQGGIFEGWQALLFSFLMCFYDLMTVVRIIEARRKSKGLPL